MADCEHCPASDELLDYVDADDVPMESEDVTAGGGCVSIHSSGFRDFLLKPELLRAVTDCGFEHPSEVQNECIPQAILGIDVVCQAKSGMGKTAVFVLATMQQLEHSEDHVSALVLCHTRELAYQINTEYQRFNKYLRATTTAVFYGGVPINRDIAFLKINCPDAIVGTPGRVLDLIRKKVLTLTHLKHFILDECDALLNQPGMRRDIQEIFRAGPRDKQVMMFTATMSKKTRDVCKLFMQDPVEVYVDDDSKLTLNGLSQHYLKLREQQKNRKLIDLLDALDFNQVIAFVKSVHRCMILSELLMEHNFPVISIHRAMIQQERLSRYKQFKSFSKRIMIASDLFGRGMDIEKVNVVFNYDVPMDSDTYLHRVARAGRFGTKGLAITFVSDAEDANVLNTVQERFSVNISELPDHLDRSLY